MLCCNPTDCLLSKDLNLEINKVSKLIPGISYKSPSRDLDFVDNPNVWKKLNISSDNKTLFETMKCEKNRWDSFDKKWPLQFINVGELVASGFFYLQSDDKVQCAFCKLVLCSWKPGDKPLKEHIKSVPKCPLLMRSADASMSVKLQPLFPYSTETSLLHPTSYKPKNPRMIDLKERLSTFRNWPHTTIKILDLAECGLYYTGVQDAVTCFYCGGSLSNWEPFDEPILEHAKFYPKCNYLRIIQNRPVYKRLKSVGSNTGRIFLPDQFQAKEVLKSNIVQQAKEIFPSSMVEDVVVQHLQRGEIFSSLHHLCEKLLEQNARMNPKVVKTEDFNVVKKPVSTSASSLLNLDATNDMLQCKICMDGEREVVFQPCGHLISCEKCAMLITKCPLCRKNIESRMRTFLS